MEKKQSWDSQGFLIIFFSRIDNFNEEDEVIKEKLLINHKSKDKSCPKKNCSIFSRRTLHSVAVEKQFDPTTFFLSQRNRKFLSSFKISNVGRTTLTLFFILSMISLMIVKLNDGAEMPLVDPPDFETLINDRFQTIIQFLGSSYDTIKAPFDGKQHLFIESKDAFICPEQRNGIKTIGSCAFMYFDFIIHNVMEAIPSYGRNFANIIISVVDQFAPDHFDVKHAINSFQLFIQRFIALPNTATPKPETLINQTSAEKSDTYRSRASFSFEPFPDDVVAVKDACTMQCRTQTEGATAFIFDDLNLIDGITTPMTKRDYIFESLGESNLYICQYAAEEKFGGTWIYFIDSCLCGDLCQSTPLYFGLFNGCADLLNRIGIPCTSETPCTLDRLCPYENTKLILKSTDTRATLSTFLNEECLKICADLAGFSTFEALVALGAVGSSFGGNFLGLSSNAFGGRLGVPTALLPGKI